MDKKVFEILIVEDDPADVDLIKEALHFRTGTPMPIHLNSVEDGEQAMLYLRRSGAFTDAVRPDLIILDLNMPRKSGHEVLQEIKTDPHLRSIPVVVLTTSLAPEDVEKSYSLGANTHISKVADFSDFLRIIKTIEEYWLRVAKLPSP